MTTFAVTTAGALSCRPLPHCPHHRPQVLEPCHDHSPTCFKRPGTPHMHFPHEQPRRGSKQPPPPPPPPPAPPPPQHQRLASNEGSGSSQSRSSGPEYAVTDSGIEVRNVISRIKEDVSNLKSSLAFIRRSSTSGNVYEDLVTFRKSRPAVPIIPVEHEPLFSDTLRMFGFYTFAKFFDSGHSKCYRFFWVLLLLCCLAVLCYQLWDRLTLYASSPSHTRVVKRLVEQLTFPAVTICNLNTYRLTKVVDLGMYRVIHMASQKIYNQTLNGSSLTNVPAVYNMSYFEFVRAVSHRKEDFIQRCHWNGMPCGPENFTEMFDLDHGLCYTFRPKQQAGVINRSGPMSGLTLLLNVEQYEYVLGRTSSVGVKVAVHDPKIHPRLHTEALNAAVGSYTSLTVDKVVRRESSTTYNGCSIFDPGRGEPKPHCYLEHDHALVRQRCGCEFKEKLHQKGKVNTCSVWKYFSCIAKYRDESKEVCEGDGCGCSTTCEWTDYELAMSEASMSVYAAESWIRAINDFEELETKFQTARDMYHRNDWIINGHDVDTLSFVSEGLDGCAHNITTIERQVTSYNSEYAKTMASLTESLNDLNTSLRLNYHNFRQRSHVQAYQNLIRVIKTNTKSILTARTILAEIQTRNVGTINETLARIQRRLGRLVVSPAQRTTRTGGLLQQIAENVQRFKIDLLNGYGQNYKEFRSNRATYESRVNKILNLTESISNNFLNRYNFISNLSVAIMLDKQRFVQHRFNNFNTLYKQMQDFFFEIEDLDHITLPVLYSSLQDLEKAYEVDKNKILALSDSLSDIETYLKRSKSTMDGVFVSVSSLVTKLRTNISTMDNIFSIAAKLYLNNKIKKSELARRLHSGQLNSLIRSARHLVEEFRQTLTTMKDGGEQLISLITPLAERVGDFTNFNEVKLDRLRVPAVASWAEGVVVLVEEQFVTIADYLSELRDFARGSRINGRFYQNNFLQMEVYFTELSETTMIQEDSYGIFALASDIGASLSLYLGASILTIFGLLDLVFRFSTTQNRS